MLLEKLERLAGDVDPYSRRALALRLSDLYHVGDHHPTQEEQDMFENIIFQVVEDLAESVVATVSEMLSRTPRISSSMAYKFANHDQIEIAGPMLERSPCLSDEQIIELCENKSDEHKTAIARRERLTENVAQLLAQQGSMRTLYEVAANDGAQLGKAGVSLLLERGGTDHAIQEQITRRINENAYLGELVRSVLTEKLRTKLGTFADILQSAGLDRLTATAEEQIAQRMREERAMRLKARFLRHKVQSNETTLETELQALVDQGRMRNIIALLASWYSIGIDQVEKAFTKGDATPVIFMLKASDLPIDLFDRVETMRCLYFGHDVFGTDEKRQAYRDLAVPDAMKTITLLQDRLAMEQGKA